MRKKQQRPHCANQVGAVQAVLSLNEEATIRAPVKSRKHIGRQGLTPPQEGHARPLRPPAAGGAAWLYGSHAVLAALHNPARHNRRLLLTAEQARNLAGRLPPTPQAEIVERARLDQLLPGGSVHQGIALLAEPLAEPSLDAACEPIAGQRNIVLLLDQVTDPHNVGAILRSAAAFGVRAVVTTERHAPETSGVLAKAASGALELVPLVRVVNLARALADLADHGYWRLGLDGGAERTLAEAAPDAPIALALGAEGTGLRRLTAERCDLLVRLPISSAIDSLNVSNAAAVALYELATRRQQT
jgi:23S rRNA (guanosine2251-2'-O)-methyltransferase